jgi:hypothetical protein
VPTLLIEFLNRSMRVPLLYALQSLTPISLILTSQFSVERGMHVVCLLTRSAEVVRVVNCCGDYDGDRLNVIVACSRSVRAL